MAHLEDRFQGSNATECHGILDSHCGCGCTIWGWALADGGRHLAAYACRYHQNDWPQCVGRDSVWSHLLALGIGICHVSSFLRGPRDSELWQRLAEFTAPPNTACTRLGTRRAKLSFVCNWAFSV